MHKYLHVHRGLSFMPRLPLDEDYMRTTPVTHGGSTAHDVHSSPAIMLLDTPPHNHSPNLLSQHGEALDTCCLH